MKTYVVDSPSICPFCGTKTINRQNSDGENSVDIYCPNQNCIGIKKSHLSFIISKSCFDIKDFGEATVNLLYDNNVITNWWEIFNLTIDDLINKVNLTQYSAEKLYYNIQNVKSNINGADILFSLGIKSIGKIKATKIINILGSLDNINFDDNIINQLNDEIGPESTKTLISGILSDYNKNIISYFKSNNFNITNSKIEIEKVSNVFNNMKLLASGTFENYSRDEIKKVIESHGGTYASGVNKTLDILICGKNIGPSKLEKAKKLGIKMINENEFEKMLKNQ